MKHFIINLWTRQKLKQLLRENAVLGKSPCVMDDLVFKVMFTENNDDARKALRYLLSTCINRKIEEFTIMNSELLPIYYGTKRVQLDINIRFNDGEIANIEMQMHKSDDNIKKRAEHYAAMLQAGQSVRGKPYKEIKRVYQIFFLNYIIFEESKKLVRRYRYMELEEHDCLPESSELIFYELPRMEEYVKDYLSGKTNAESRIASRKNRTVGLDASR